MSVQALINRHPHLHPARLPLSFPGSLIVVWPAPGGLGVCSRGHAGSWYGYVRTHLQWGHPSGDPVPKDTWNSSGCSPLGTHSRAGSGDIPLGMCLRGGSGDTSVGTPLRGHSREVGAYLWGHPLAVTRAVGTSILGHGGGRHHFGTSCGADVGDVPLGTCWQWEHPSGNTPAMCPSGGRSQW